MSIFYSMIKFGITFKIRHNKNSCWCLNKQKSCSNLFFFLYKRLRSKSPSPKNDLLTFVTNFLQLRLIVSKIVTKNRHKVVSKKDLQNFVTKISKSFLGGGDLDLNLLYFGIVFKRLVTDFLIRGIKLKTIIFVELT